MAANGHFAAAGQNGAANFEHGVQVVDELKEFNPDLAKYLQQTGVAHAGFHYHLISVFGSQSTGKSTLLNALFSTDFGVMSEAERKQTTRGIWLSKNKSTAAAMADNILVMDVEGTDGRERGEDQDFERKSSLFALATSEVLMVNIWEHQVGLYQGANMGLLKTVFEVNLQLFLKDGKSRSRSLLYFVIRDFLGTTPLQNLRNTLMQDMARIWASLSKPPGLETSSIDDYFDFAFTALPHKLYQPEQRDALRTQFEGGVFLPEYHRRIPADGFSHYAEGVWDQIVNNKDLDLPTQQELLAQFRCDEIMRDVMVAFDHAITPLETKQSGLAKSGLAQVLPNLGAAMKAARASATKAFDTDAGRYHKAVYQRKRAELEAKMDARLKALFAGQLTAAHKQGVEDFSRAVSDAVKSGQRKGGSYDFAAIVKQQKAAALQAFDSVAKASLVDGLPWAQYGEEAALYHKDLDKVSAQLRKDEMRRLATRVERWVRSKLTDSIWDRIWLLFTATVGEAEARFSERARSFDASADEVALGIWRLRRKSWAVLRAKIEEEMMEGNLLLKLRENFEDKFRYDDDGVPRIWRPTDDIEGIYTKARESTLELIPLLAKFRHSETGAPPPLDRWIGNAPASAAAAADDDGDLPPIGGVDEDEGKSLEEESTMLNDAKRQDLTVRFKKAADGVYVEAKRSAIGGITQVPLYFYVLLLVLGWNELVAVLRNPVYFLFLLMLGAGAYITYQLNLWGPMINMASAASAQALEEGKKKLRDFLESTETGRQALAMPDAGNSMEMRTVRSRAKVKSDDLPYSLDILAMADLDCARTLVAMKTNAIEEKSKEDRLAAVILSVMRDYGLADGATALKRPAGAATDDTAGVATDRCTAGAGTERRVAGAGIDYRTAGVATGHRTAGAATDHRTAGAATDHRTAGAATDDTAAPRKRRKLTSRPAAIEPNPASTLPTPPISTSDVDEGLQDPPSTQHMYGHADAAPPSTQHVYGHVNTSPALPISPVSEPASRGRRRSTNPSASSPAGDRSRPNLGQDAGSPGRKRYKLGEQGGKTKSRGEQIGACMKAVFNDWETVFDELKGEHVPKDAAAVLAEGIYDDARALLPADGPGTLHHDEEIAMAADAGFSEGKGNLADYYVRKYRTALGFVFLTEHNLRLRAATEKPSYIEFNKTQAQMFPRGDVNVTSRWFSKWKAWGWFPDMKVNRDLNPKLEGLFPPHLRTRLIDQAIGYEDANSDCKQWKYYPAIART
ncbi:hypothetical protein DV737_g1488, partial [Chaetothyriales sp. CBS 132003]